MSWEKKPAIQSSGAACLCCGTPTQMFPMEGLIAVGFGSATVTCDGREIYSENMVDDDAELWTGQDAENAALANPDHDWRITKYAPLYDAVYQRHGDGQWALIERGDGFA